MATLRESIVRAFGALGRRRGDADLEEELRSHVELATGASRNARGVAHAMDALRDQRGLPWLDDFVRDFRHALRLLRSDPVFTAVAVVSLALGIGATSAIFSLADILILRPLPIPNPGAVMTVTAEGSEEDIGGFVSYPNYRDLREQARSFDGLLAYNISTLAFARAPNAAREMRMGMLVSDNFFDALGVAPPRDRSFARDETAVPGRDAVVVLSDDFWRSAFGANPSTLGSVIWLNGIDFHVIGIAPASFTGPEPPLRPAFYVPTAMASRLDQKRANVLENRGARAFHVKGRLRSGVSRRTAQAELTTTWDSLARQYPDSNAHRTIAVRTELEQRIRSDPWDAITVGLMGGLAALLLIIACANVANLMLSRVRNRSREMAIRLALGVSRPRLVRQLLTEGLLLSLLGGAAGLGVAYAGIRFLQTIPAGDQIAIAPQLDERVVIFTLLAAMATAAVFAIAPARQSVRTNLVPALKTSEVSETKGPRTIGRNVLVVAQVAAAMVVLLAAGMMLDGFRKALVLDPGFRIDHLMMMSLDPSLVRYTPQQTRTFYGELVDRARALPGVRSVALTSAVPFSVAEQEVDEIVPEGYQLPRGQASESTFTAVVDERYFDTMQVKVIRGRPFTDTDTAASRAVAIVNEQFANRYWPNQDPIGKRIRLPNKRQPGSASLSGERLEIVGVTRTGKYLWIAEAPMPFLYLPFAQQDRTRMSLLVESTSADASGLAAPLRELVASIDVAQPIANAQTFAQLYRQRAVAVPTIIMQTVGTIGVLGLTLALIGVYGLVAYSVTRRTREIGIRMAIGAAKSDVLAMVLRQGLILSVSGIAVGGVASVVVARALSAALVGIGRPNPITYIIVPLLLAGMTTAASYVPARRASLVDPLVALRYE